MGTIMMHWTYLDMICREIETVRRVDKIEIELMEQINTQPPVPNRSELIELFVYHYKDLRSSSILEVMVLSAMMLEAYINNIAKQKLPGFDRDALDKLDIAGKWVIIPKLAFGSGPDAGSHLIARIKAIQVERNFLVHAKPIFIDCTTIKTVADVEKLRPIKTEKAESAVKTCFDALSEIRRIAPDFEKRQFEILMPDQDRIRRLVSRAVEYEMQAK